LRLIDPTGHDVQIAIDGNPFLWLDELNRRCCDRCGDTMIGEKRDEQPLGYSPKLCPTGDRLRTGINSERSGRPLSCLCRDSCVADPGSKVPSGIPILPDRQVAVCRSLKAASQFRNRGIKKPSSIRIACRVFPFVLAISFVLEMRCAQQRRH
jgi:hypothetical protein